jgi:dipeptidyl aminopeptidase/acylaminoacyl peptidase
VGLKLSRENSNELMTRIYRFLICAMMAVATVPRADEQRTATPDDIARLEQFGEIAFSPDGHAIAFVRRRPLMSARSYQQSFLWGDDRADIWLASIDDGRAPTNLTMGESDGSGYWLPTWSPDGARLAMLSTKGGDNVQLWVWEKATGHFARLSERGIAWLAGRPPGFAWLDNERIVAALLPMGEKPLLMTLEQQAGIVAMREWPKAWSGREATASILDSGGGVDLTPRPQSELEIIDVRTSAARSLAVAPSLRDVAGLSLRDVTVAPDNCHFAFLKGTSLRQPDSATLLQHTSRYETAIRYRLEIAEACGRITSTEASRATFVLPGTFRWSLDGGTFAFIGTEQVGEGAFRVFRGTTGGAFDRVALASEVDPRAIIWAANERLLISAEHEVRVDGKLTKRLDWWSVSAAGAPRMLTEKLMSAPADLLPVQDGRRFIGIAAGDLWRLDIESGAWTNLTATFDPEIAGITRPTSDIPRAATLSSVVVSVRQGMRTDYYRVDVISGRRVRLERPSDLATLAAYRANTDIGVFTANESTGTFVWIVQGEARRQLLKTNEFVRDIAQGEFRIIDYRSLDGEDLKGWVIMPANYEAGKRYPLVTWVYAGWIAKDAPPSEAYLNFDPSTNLQLLAAHGYAVLLPSMPLPPVGSVGSDPYFELTKGVLPAVDKAIDLGIADPKRLAIMGHSYGGYSTYGLVTLTNRFQAAIVLAGLSDLVSFYGVFDSRFRYEPYPHEHIAQKSIAETGQLRMGNPPWKDAARYVRNSPLFYVDRVQTPLLIIQGDMDFVSMTQGEQFFSALYRQGKRARFVRYWGEGHALSSPANLRDVWTQIYAWLDLLLNRE